MRAQTVSELITNSYTLTLDEFLGQYPDPMLIGVGIVDALLLENSDVFRSTLALGASDPDPDDKRTRHHLVGVLIPIANQNSPSWDRIGIGRSNDNEIVVDDPAVSEYHCYIRKNKTNNELLLGDLGSTNGTKINGRRLIPPETHPLVDEDVLTFGRCSFQYFTPKELYEYLSLGPA